MLVVSHITHSLKCYQCMQMVHPPQLVQSTVTIDSIHQALSQKYVLVKAMSASRRLTMHREYNTVSTIYICHSSRIESETPAIALPNAWHALEIFSKHFCPYCTNFIMLSLSKNFPNLDFLCCFCQAHSIALFSGLQILAPFTFAKPRISMLSSTESQHTWPQ